MTRLRPAPEVRDRGFTLVELLVVIIIVGVPAAVAVPVFLNQRRKAVDASLKADLRALAQWEETWIVEHPGTTGTQTAADFAGFRRSSPHNQLEVYANAHGYCLVGTNARSSATGGMYWVYDSAAGGLQAGVMRSPAVVPVGVACAYGWIGAFVP